jgi:soluble lytic murein transglycosylase-like protein
MSESQTKTHDKKFITLVIFTIMGLLSLCIVGLVILYFLHKDINYIRFSQKENQINQIKTNQLLLSSMDWSTKRQKYILFMRDMMLNEWAKIGEKKIDISKAYDYSEIIMRNVENFPHIDPSLILSMACVESSFGEKATSFMGAVGMLQIMPLTAKPYFELYSIPYSDSALYKPPINLKIGIKYFADILSCYPNMETSVAVYNGGKWGSYYPDSMLKVPEETRRYVPCVVAKWKEYKDKFETYRIDSLLIKSGSKKNSRTKRT